MNVIILGARKVLCIRYKDISLGSSIVWIDCLSNQNWREVFNSCTSVDSLLRPSWRAVLKRVLKPLSGLQLKRSWLIMSTMATEDSVYFREDHGERNEESQVTHFMHLLSLSNFREQISTTNFVFQVPWQRECSTKDGWLNFPVTRNMYYPPIP